MTISDLIRPDLVVDLRSTTGPDALRELAGFLAERREGINADELFRILHERELRGSTALGQGVAIPHGKSVSLGSLVACLGRSRSGINFGSPGGGPTHLFFALVAPEAAAGAHLKALARISRLFQDPGLAPRLIKAQSIGEMHRILMDEEAKV